MSVKQILENAWEECKEQGVELSTVDFTILRGIGGESSPCEVEYSGRAILPEELNREWVKGKKEVALLVTGGHEVDYIEYNGNRYEKPQNQPDE